MDLPSGAKKKRVCSPELLITTVRSPHGTEQDRLAEPEYRNKVERSAVMKRGEINKAACTRRWSRTRT